MIPINDTIDIFREVGGKFVKHNGTVNWLVMPVTEQLVKYEDETFSYDVGTEDITIDVAKSEDMNINFGPWNIQVYNHKLFLTAN